jgi:hypothetical protein
VSASKIQEKASFAGLSTKIPQLLRRAPHNVGRIFNRDDNPTGPEWSPACHVASFTSGRSESERGDEIGNLARSCRDIPVRFSTSRQYASTKVDCAYSILEHGGGYGPETC